ncbi:AsnC family transcriptional regulator [Clostridia bacterium]|nr:AsnC family transcriptional regulator [Clostridia bacterium]
MDKLLKLLSENANLTTNELALLLDEPEDYISSQINEYENSGVIMGYRATINREKVADAGTTAIIELKVTPKRDSGFDEIAARVMSFEEVDTVYLMAGSFDLLVIVRGETVQQVAMFVAQKLSTLESVLATNTHFLLKTYKESGSSFYEDDSLGDKRSLIV